MIIRFGIMTLSDRSARGVRADLSGPLLSEHIKKHDWSVAKESIYPDDEETIRSKLIEWADSGVLDIILTTGGTGFGPRDVTPEATRAVISREAPGLAEVMRAAGLKKTPYAMLSRAVAGIRGKTAIINLPGNPDGAIESLEVILPGLEHAVRLLREDASAGIEHER